MDKLAEEKHEAQLALQKEKESLVAESQTLMASTMRDFESRELSVRTDSQQALQAAQQKARACLLSSDIFFLRVTIGVNQTEQGQKIGNAGRTFGCQEVLQLNVPSKASEELSHRQLPYH